MEEGRKGGWNGREGRNGGRIGGGDGSRKGVSEQRRWKGKRVGRETEMEG